MPTRTERYRFLPITIEDVNAIPQPLPGGYADVTRGGWMTFERVVFLGPDSTSRAELHLKKGHVKKLEQARIASRVDPPGDDPSRPIPACRRQPLWRPTPPRLRAAPSRASRSFRRKKTDAVSREAGAKTALLLTVSREAPFRLLPRVRRLGQGLQQQLQPKTKKERKPVMSKQPEQLSPDVLRQFTGTENIVSPRHQPQSLVYGRGEACGRLRRRLLAAR